MFIFGKDVDSDFLFLHLTKSLGVVWTPTCPKKMKLGTEIFLLRCVRLDLGSSFHDVFI